MYYCINNKSIYCNNCFFFCVDVSVSVRVKRSFMCHMLHRFFCTCFHQKGNEMDQITQMVRDYQTAEQILVSFFQELYPTFGKLVKISVFFSYSNTVTEEKKSNFFPISYYTFLLYLSVKILCIL